MDEVKKEPEAAATKPSLWHFTFRTALFAIIGIVAGAAGALLAFGYLSDYFSSLVEQPVARVTSPTARLVSPGTFESAVENARERVIPALAVFYTTKSGKAVEDGIYFDTDILGYGVVFTSDGWLIAPGEIFKNTKIGNALAKIGGSIYSLDSMLIDKTTGAAFVKITAQNLAVVQIADEEFMDSGDRIAIVFGRDEFISSNIVSKFYDPSGVTTYLQNSDTPANRLLIAAGGAPLGAPILNYEAEVIGLVWGKDAEGGIGLSFELLTPAMKSMLKEGRITRPLLGVRYLDLARISGIDDEITAGQKEGALVWPGKDDVPPAVVADSPAEAAGIREGDIILSLNDVILNSRGSLAYLLLEYAPGDKISLGILRDGKTEIVSVTLGESEEKF
ncbi:MAG: PDZ domain-containing protein [Patescibacteria group bacterium]|nr:PDZ domain-containing protein [Patescibacteria group bacterium]